MIAGNPEPSEAEWQAQGQAHWRGDPLADAVIGWMHAEGMDRAWPKLEAALAQGLSAAGPQDHALRAYLQAAVSATRLWAPPCKAPVCTKVWLMADAW